MLRTLGADLVGMSTVHEIIAARHIGMKCLVLSLVANPAAGVTAAPLHHAEVLEAGTRRGCARQGPALGAARRPRASLSARSGPLARRQTEAGRLTSSQSPE